LYRPYLHFVLPRLAGILTGEPEAYRYLGRSIETFPRGAAFLQVLERNGFTSAKAEPLSGGIVTVYLAAKA
jgi:demethylmenaquinone methyltransferase/2-methoxy-6-polyprenyl-1,4-benzoquinol methylase